MKQSQRNSENNITIWGVSVTLLSVICFGITTTFAKLAYAEGATALTLILSRFLTATLLFSIVCVIIKKPVTLKLEDCYLMGAGAFIWYVSTTTYLVSVYFIPVGLAAIIFFTFPVIINIYLLLKEKRKKTSWLIPFWAFGGLTLSIGPSFGVLNPIGLSLAFISAVSTAGLYLMTQHLVGKHGLLKVALYMNTGGAVLTGLVLMTIGETGLPSYSKGLSTGWMGFIGASIAYPIAVLFMFKSIHALGPAKTSILFNLEPIISIAAAFLLLSEKLNITQSIGVMIVFSAIILTTLQKD